MSDLVTKKLGYKDNFKFVIMENYTNFKGRAGRGEYWRFTALYICLSTIIQVLSALLRDTFLGIVFSLLSLAVSFGLLLPSIAVSVRRLHDIGKSGWMLLVSLIPLVGWFYVVYLLAKRGDEDVNEYGPVVGYETVTAEMASETGLEQTPTSGMDKAVAVITVVIYVVGLAIIAATTK